MSEASLWPQVRSAVDELIDNVTFYVCEIGGHIVGSALLIVGMRIIEWFIDTLWKSAPVVFDGSPFAFPIKWLFNLADMVVFGGFLMLAGASILFRVRQAYFGHLTEPQMSIMRPVGPALPPVVSIEPLPPEPPIAA